MKAGAVEFLIKPFSAEVMMSAIGSALERSQASREAASEVRMLEELYYSLSSREREVMGLVVSGSDEQASRLQAWNQRDYREGSPWPGDAENEGGLVGRIGEHCCQARHSGAGLKPAHADTNCKSPKMLKLLLCVREACRKSCLRFRGDHVTQRPVIAEAAWIRISRWLPCAP